MRVLRFFLAALVALAGFVALVGITLVGVVVLLGQKFRRKFRPGGRLMVAPAGRSEGSSDVIDVVATESGEGR